MRQLYLRKILHLSYTKYFSTRYLNLDTRAHRSICQYTLWLYRLPLINTSARSLKQHRKQQQQRPISTQHTDKHCDTMTGEITCTCVCVDTLLVRASAAVRDPSSSARPNDIFPAALITESGAAVANCEVANKFHFMFAVPSPPSRSL